MTRRPHRLHSPSNSKPPKGWGPQGVRLRARRRSSCPSPRRCSRGTSVAEPDRRVGPGLGDDIARTAARVASCRRPTSTRRRRSTTRTATSSAKRRHVDRARRRPRRPVPLGRRRRPLLHQRRAAAAGASCVSSINRWRSHRPRRRRLIGQYVAYAVRFPAAPENVRFYVGPKQLDVMREHRSGVHARDLLRHVRLAGGAAARRAASGCTDTSATGAGRSSS